MIRRLVTRRAIHKKLDQEVAAGRMTAAEARRIKRVATSKACELAVQRTMQSEGIEDYPVLNAIYQFIVEYWDEILKIILTLVPLILDGEDD